MWRHLLASRPVLATAIVGGLLLVGAADFATGFDLLLSFFYLVPVALCAWHFGRPAVAAAGLSAGVVWFVADVASNHAYTSAWLRVWNSAMCGGSALVLGLVLHRLRVSLEHTNKINAELKLALAQLDDSTKKTRQLMGQLQVVCAWTQRIKVDGKWMNLDEFLSKHLKLELSHGISPEAMAKMLTESEGQGDGKAQ